MTMTALTLGACSESDDVSTTTTLTPDSTTTPSDPEVNSSGETTTTTTDVDPDGPQGLVELVVAGSSVPLKAATCAVSPTTLEVEAFSPDGQTSVTVKIPEESSFGPSFDTFAAGTSRTFINVSVQGPAADDVMPEGYELTLDSDLRSGSFKSLNPPGIDGKFSCP